MSRTFYHPHQNNANKGHFRANFKNAAKTGPQNNSKSLIAKIVGEFKDRNRAEIKKWRQALDAAADITTPRLYLIHDLYDNLGSDGHLISQTMLRKSATLAKPFSIVDRKSGKPDIEKTDLFTGEWFNNFMSMALDAVFRGYTLLELINPSTLDFMVVPRRNVVPQKKMVLLEVGADKGINYEKGFENTLIEVSHPGDLGIMAHLCGQLIWKRNAQQSWAEFTEKFGMPLITASTNKTAQADLDKIEDMLISLGEAARAVLPEGTTIDIKPFAGSDSYKVYDMQIERINSEIAKPITGGTMITDQGSSRSQSEVHERNLDDKIALQDKRMIEFIVNGRLLALMQAWGHPVNPETDRFMFDTAYELSLKEHWEIINAALNKYEIPDEWISKTFNFPIDGRKAEQQTQPPQGAFSANFR